MPRYAERTKRIRREKVLEILSDGLTRDILGILKPYNKNPGNGRFMTRIEMATFLNTYCRDIPRKMMGASHTYIYGGKQCLRKRK